MIRIISGIFLLLIMSGCWEREVQRDFYDSGRLRSIATLKNGLLDGVSKSYYESGALKTDAHYKYGLLNGLAREYYESGSLKAQTFFENGILNGVSISWAEDGTEIDRVEFVWGALKFSDVE